MYRFFLLYMGNKVNKIGLNIILEKIKKNREFSIVYKEGVSLANKYLVMYCKKNGLAYSRIGISVSKKVGNSIVRHRVTRLIREAYRLNEKEVVEGYDIVIIARATIKGKTYYEVESAILHLIKLHKIMKND